MSRRPLLLSTLVFFALPAAAEYTAVEVISGGSIRGRITYNGKPPAPRKVDITKDVKVCGETRVDDLFTIGAGGAVKDVVVFLADIKSGKKMEMGNQPVLDQKGCHYQPHLQVVPLHSALQVRSSDPILHNVHSFLNGSTVINFAMPPRPGLVLVKQLDKPGGEQLKCDIHNFMTGGIFVAENPYYAMTAEDGTYQIKDVPAGTYTIATWHPAAGPISETVTVPANGDVTFDGRIR